MTERTPPQHFDVLVIEDDPDEVRLIRAFLAEKETNLFNLRCADRLSAGLDILARKKPDVILLDLNLPDSNGLATFTRTRDHAAGVPIVILSATSDEETVLTAIRNGAQDYLVKERLTRYVLVRAIRYAIERKQAEQALQESEAFKNRILESSPDCIKVLDLEGRLLFMSKGGQQTMEIADTASVMNSQWIDFWKGPDKVAARAAVEAASAGGMGRFVGFCPTATGKPKWWDVLVVPVLDAEGKPERLLSLSRDITERKQSEELLLEMNVALMNAMPGISWLDPDGRYLKVNDAYAGMVGYEVGEMVGMDWAATVSLDDRPIAMAAYQRMLSEGKAEFEARAVRKDGFMFHKHVLMVKRVDKEGHFSGHYCCMRDITERKRTERALQESQQWLCRLLEDRERISRDLHDNIIQMLYAIGLNLEDCQRLVGEDSKAAVKSLSGITKNLNALIKDVRSYIVWAEPKISNGQELIRAIERLVPTMEGAHLLHFRLNLDQEAADHLTSEEAGHVLHVVREAMSNSLRHSEANSGLVSLQRRDGHVRLQMEDDGVGFSLHGHKGGGEGLRNITARAKELGAKLEIVSEPGKGVRVVLDIPKKSARASA